MKLKRVLESGIIGKVSHSRVDSFWWRGGNYYDLWWRGTWAKEGGGCTMNHAVHQIDLFLWMMGPPAEVQSVSLNLARRTPKWRIFPRALSRSPTAESGRSRRRWCITAKSNSWFSRASGPKWPCRGK